MTAFTLSTAGTKWPSGDFNEVAVLPLSDAKLVEIFGPFLCGIEPDLGQWNAVGFALPDSSLVELIRYVSSPPPHGYILRIDKSAPVEPTLSQVLTIVGLFRDELPWVTSRWP